jgi:hypothetical protein
MPSPGVVIPGLYIPGANLKCIRRMLSFFYYYVSLAQIVFIAVSLFRKEEIKDASLDSKKGTIDR